MKLAILYHSASGNTKSIAEIMKETADGIKDIEAKAMDVENLDKNFLTDAKAVVFGCPTYYGTVSWQLKKFLDTTDVKLAGKLGGTFATENNIGGGADFAELTIIACLLVRGMLIYSGGTIGTPSTHFGSVTVKKGDDFQKERARVFIQKIANKAKEIF